MPSKYHNIIYPVFGLKKNPEPEIYFDKVTDGSGLVIKHQDYNGSSYLQTLENLDKHEIPRIQFRYTCRNPGELIRSKAKWIIDNSGRMIDLSTKEPFLVRSCKVTKIKDEYLWLQSVSYPFIFPVSLEAERDNILIYYFVIAYINQKWEIASIQKNPFLKSRIWL